MRTKIDPAQLIAAYHRRHELPAIWEQVRPGLIAYGHALNRIVKALGERR